jgi:hypothetical protein
MKRYFNVTNPDTAQLDAVIKKDPHSVTALGMLGPYFVVVNKLGNREFFASYTYAERKYQEALGGS